MQYISELLKEVAEQEGELREGMLFRDADDWGWEYRENAFGWFLIKTSANGRTRISDSEFHITSIKDLCYIGSS